MKTENKTKIGSHSELRQDIVTGDWVVIATGRAKRPEDFSKNEKVEACLANGEKPEECLFCDPEKSGQEKDVLMYKRSDGDWSLRVFPNKFPAFSPNVEIKPLGEGPFFSMNGYGYHEVIVTRDHNRHIPFLEELEIAEIFDAYQDRYLDLMNRQSINYISIFHNHGKESGASIGHPHSQLMAVPVISPYVEMELRGAENYYRSNKECVYCRIAEYESEASKRVIFENDQFIAFCPYASRAAFEVWVMPKKHESYFERITQEEKTKIAEVLKKVMRSIYQGLNDPPYNFYVHTSPCNGQDYPHYHWHVEILPHTAIWAGFELQTGIEISTIQPEVAAKYLREKI